MLDNNTGVAEWYGIYGTRHIPFWKSNFFIWGVYLCGALIAFAVFIFFICKYRKNAVKISPRSKALQELKTIRSRYLRTDQAPVFYVKLTQAVKNYLSEELSLDVTSKTDTEALDIIRLKSGSVDGIDNLGAIFSHVERIKFAQGTVGLEKMKQDADSFDFFIELQHKDKKIDAHN